MQRNWIGRSAGARVRFALGAVPGVSETAIEVFTTRIDTIYGATFVMLAPEHPLVEQFAAASPDPAAFRARVARFKSQDRTARMMGEVEKEGFDTGRVATNPFTNQPVPVWIANFVLGEYGTGAVMGVPAHDQRDFEFATQILAADRRRRETRGRRRPRRQSTWPRPRRATASSSRPARSRASRATRRARG